MLNFSYVVDVTASSICLTNRFHVVLGLFSYRSQMTSNVVKTRRWYARVCHRCSYYILTSSVIYYWTNTRQHGICSLYTMKREEKATYLPRIAWLFEDLCHFGHFWSCRRYFSSLLLLSFFILLAYSFSEKIFIAFTCSKQNNGENIFRIASLS